MIGISIANSIGYYRGGQGYNLDTGFDVLNLQSNTADNFILSGSAISQWTDLSGSGRHATQATSTARPTLNSLSPTFDGTSDFLTLASEFTANVYSLYLVSKIDVGFTGIRTPIGGSSVNDYVGHGASFPKQLRMVNTGTTGGSTRSFNLYGEEYYQVLSIRRNGGLETIKCNGRTLRTSSSSNTANQVFGNIGRQTTATYWQGIIKAVCIHSEYKDDETDDSIVNALFSRYNLPEVSDAFVGFGDSITAGTGATTPITGGWLPLLATAQGKYRKNFGVGGSRLTAFDTSSGVTRYASEVIERPYSDTLCILYGTNDITAGVSGSDFQSALETVLNGFISVGYTNSKIIVGTVPYRTGDADAADVADYNTRITSVCSALGLPEPADVYNSMKNGGGDTLMSDTVHPNDSGHAVIKDAFAARIA